MAFSDTEGYDQPVLPRSPIRALCCRLTKPLGIANKIYQRKEKTPLKQRRCETDLSFRKSLYNLGFSWFLLHCCCLQGKHINLIIAYAHTWGEAACLCNICTLIFSTPWAKSEDGVLKQFFLFFFFFLKIGFDISSRLSPKETICICKGQELERK